MPSDNLWAISSALARLLSAAFTSWANCLALSNKVFFSSPFAAPTDLDKIFCLARKLSNSEIALRRRSSAASNLSTNSGSSPRTFCDARNSSGFSRRCFKSIICS
ncbi:unannotated protein [freshwater metagenome]|uniref:Unannotated protein n=1 Tax=freshwater metagenome TaxID=449393 RepID=A0A6J5Z476_9ZZZZ